MLGGHDLNTINETLKENLTTKWDNVTILHVFLFHVSCVNRTYYQKGFEIKKILSRKEFCCCSFNTDGIDVNKAQKRFWENQFNPLNRNIIV